MAEKEKEQMLGLTVKKEDDFSEWYNQVVLKAQLADFGPIKGFMVIRPNAFQLWEKIQNIFNEVIQEKKVKNAYFPLLIPKSFFEKEASHVEGFAPELAWIENKEEGEEKVAIRPTSETIMYDSYAKWIRSWRDLPLRINQWCNVLRWEVKQTKLFLRTREFLWQEGHCVYETEKECLDEALMFLNEYKNLMENYLAIPVITGEKTEKERFPGAKQTFTLEALMPDGKALQMGTSHNLGQNFSKTFKISFLGKDKKEHLAWQNSWGFSTRLLGAIIMVHGDNKGIVVPPKIAREKIVIVPILFEASKEKVLMKAKELNEKLKKFNSFIDEREEYSAGFKFNEWELKGIPLRLELGPKDLEKNQCILVKRNSGEKKAIKLNDVEKEIEKALNEIHKEMFLKAEKFLKENIVKANSWNEFIKAIEGKKMVECIHCLSPECEEEIKNTTTASSRCIPFNSKEKGKCIKCGKEGKKVLFAKAY
ncbi:MAG: proline--tRNA ligase [Candidatus Diapherotrites archaeon]|nr:proline--tRNA ligase [Candidatus Diapherotrites archaeon]